MALIKTMWFVGICLISMAAECGIFALLIGLVGPIPMLVLFIMLVGGAMVLNTIAYYIKKICNAWRIA